METIKLTEKENSEKIYGFKIMQAQILYTGYLCTLSYQDGDEFPYSFEVMDIPTMGERFYQEGGLVIQEGIVKDYDGVSGLHIAVVYALNKMGCGFGPYILPGSCF